jgi:putative oxidoreductase
MRNDLDVIFVVMKNIFFNSGNHKPLSSVALLILRASFGLMMLTHGWPKLVDFAQGSSSLGDPINIGSKLSIVLVIFAEFLCSILVVLGLGTRFAAFPIMVVMFVASFIINASHPVADRELSVLYLSAFTAILVLGAGNYSLDKAISGK